jgi:hypothetical protein
MLMLSLPCPIFIEQEHVTKAMWLNSVDNGSKKRMDAEVSFCGWWPGY